MIPTILNEIERRKYDERTVYAVIGTEIRLRRLIFNKTLKFVSYNVCSVSYAAKIESNSIKPNYVYLNEISRRLGLDSKQVDALLELRDELILGVKAMLTNNFTEIEKFINQHYGLLNFRYKLLVFLYNVNVDKMDDLETIYNELLKVSTIMTNFDYKIFLLISGIYHFKIGKVAEAHDILKLLLELEVNKDILCIVTMYLFITSNILSKPETPHYYNALRDLLLEIGSYPILDDMNYYLAIYYVRNKSFEFAERILNTVKDNQKRRTVEFLIAYANGKSIRKFSRKQLLGNARCLYDFYHSPEFLESDLKELDNGCFKIDFSPIYIKYLTLTNSDEKYEFIMQEVVAQLNQSKDSYLTKFFVEQAYLLSKETNKYKGFLEIYERICERV